MWMGYSDSGRRVNDFVDAACRRPPSGLWAKGEPNNAFNKEDCVYSITIRGRPHMNDVRCGKRYKYYCPCQDENPGHCPGIKRTSETATVKNADRSTPSPLYNMTSHAAAVARSGSSETSIPSEVGTLPRWPSTISSDHATMSVAASLKASTTKSSTGTQADEPNTSYITTTRLPEFSVQSTVFGGEEPMAGKDTSYPSTESLITEGSSEVEGDVSAGTEQSPSSMSKRDNSTLALHTTVSILNTVVTDQDSSSSLMTRAGSSKKNHIARPTRIPIRACNRPTFGWTCMDATIILSLLFVTALMCILCAVAIACCKLRNRGTDTQEIGLGPLRKAKLNKSRSVV